MTYFSPSFLSSTPKCYSRVLSEPTWLGEGVSMARKKGEGQQRRKKPQAQYDELDKYPVMPPHAFARIVRDKQTLNIIYQIIEPPMTKKEQEQRDEILDISFVHSRRTLKISMQIQKPIFELQWIKSSNPMV